MSATLHDRRLKSRIKIEGPMTYHLENINDTHEGELEDLSEKGALIWINQDLPLTSQLFCRVEADDEEQTGIEFIATLLHAHPQQRESLYGYGCSIDEIKLPD